jgi:thiosulfate sulfurtransferase
MAKFQTLSITDAMPLLSQPETLILDCRDLKDYRIGHIHNAMHVHQQLRDSLIKTADKQRPLLIYCYYGHASEHLAEMFGDFDFKQVYSLAGGFAAWQEHHNL